MVIVTSNKSQRMSKHFICKIIIISNSCSPELFFQQINKKKKSRTMQVQFLKAWTSAVCNFDTQKGENL
jgi:hypothetical protein